MDGSYHAVKLLAEVLAFSMLSLAIYTVYSVRGWIASYFGRRTWYYVLLGLIIFWAGYAENVMNDVIISPITKILDDVLVAVGMFLILFAGVRMKKRLRVRPRVVVGGASVLPSGAFICPPMPVEALLELLKGRKVIAITRNPEPYRKKNVPHLWLSSVPAEDAVPPTKLAPILHRLLSEADKNTFIVIDGLEYLILNNGFDAVFKFLVTLKDYLFTKNAGMIVLVDEETLEPRERFLLHREFRELPVEAPQTL
ncbi:DUF835 domain-containing protein [Thermococcus sp.]|uniref:DUF835 domain-containing protein n=1 Tax=Thermococcus sp. TaxID=35749 RepID=UPI0026264CA1|nr:DUF835 domain-containing protein [Thermococcus sp.]